LPRERDFLARLQRGEFSGGVEAAVPPHVEAPAFVRVGHRGVAEPLAQRGGVGEGAIDLGRRCVDRALEFEGLSFRGHCHPLFVNGWSGCKD
jgi:hypothetical protein